MFDKCKGNCITCGKCASAAILDEYCAKGQVFTPRQGYGIAVDLGTTTIVLALIDLSCGSVVARHSFMNPQRAFGPDVISRIDAANKGYLAKLCHMITDSISGGITILLAAKNISPKKIVDIVVAGNTVMTYLLLELPCENLGITPFKAIYKLEKSYDSKRLFGLSELQCSVRVTPWMTAYVGGDVTAGLIYVIAQGKRRFLLMDLGTNGEMLLYGDGRLTVTATAAGPAFEQPVMASKNFQGASGVINTLAELVRQELVDEAGALENEVIFTQKQVRDLQLAKSAIRSGLEILLEINGYDYGDLETVYLAGGIGQGMNVQDAADIGLIPKALKNKTLPVGNASLGGAATLLTCPPQTAGTIDELLPAVTEINLAAYPRFHEYFMEYMSF